MQSFTVWDLRTRPSAQLQRHTTNDGPHIQGYHATEYAVSRLRRNAPALEVRESSLLEELARSVGWSKSAVDATHMMMMMMISSSCNTRSSSSNNDTNNNNNNNNYSNDNNSNDNDSNDTLTSSDDVVANTKSSKTRIAASGRSINGAGKASKGRNVNATAHEHVFDFVGTDVHRLEDITDVHVHRAYLRTSHSKKPYCPVMMHDHSTTSSSRHKESSTPSVPEQTRNKKPARRSDSVISAGSIPASGSLCIYSRCKTNPNCVNYLGQKEWGLSNDVTYAAVKSRSDCAEPVKNSSSSSDALSRFARAQGLPSPNPHTLERGRDIEGCGLRNLAATCYLNSLLQVWFHNHALRNGVYRVTFSKTEGDHDEVYLVVYFRFELKLF
jgi:hypothetical protein